MQCPRCGNQWDQSKGLCPNCGLTIHRPSSSSARGTGKENGISNTSHAEYRQQPGRPYPSTIVPGQASIASPLSARSSVAVHAPPLHSGDVLRNGQYFLQEYQTRYEWRAGIFEALWIAQDVSRGGTRVMIKEVVLPEHPVNEAQTILRTAAMTLGSIGRFPRIPELWDAFRDHGRGFFVFEPIEGESLLARMQRNRGLLSEQEAVECCLQMVEVLEFLVQQSPPLIHGLIRPECIIARRDTPLYMLSNFSVVLAGGAKQFVSGTEQGHLSPYAPSEIDRGIIDGRSDIYSLLATAYYCVTGYEPQKTPIGSIAAAREKNPSISPAFEAILTKGLHPVPSQRYQRPFALQQALLSLREAPAPFADQGRPYQMVSRPQVGLPNTENLSPHGQVQLPVTPTLVMKEEGSEKLLPRPEDLPSIRQGNDRLQASVLFVSILIALVILVLVSHL